MRPSSREKKHGQIGYKMQLHASSSYTQLFLGSLLSSTGILAACLSQQQLQSRIDRFTKLQMVYTDSGPTQRTPTCERTAEELRGEPNGRSLSPWIYRIEREDDRYPTEIARAQCLCKGCIVNGRHDYNLNSVPVYAPLIILKRIQCSEPGKYYIQKQRIDIPVGCTCVVPKQENNK